MLFIFHLYIGIIYLRSFILAGVAVGYLWKLGNVIILLAFFGCPLFFRYLAALETSHWVYLGVSER